MQNFTHIFSNFLDHPATSVDEMSFTVSPDFNESEESTDFSWLEAGIDISGTIKLEKDNDLYMSVGTTIEGTDIAFDIERYEGTSTITFVPSKQFIVSYQSDGTFINEITFEPKEGINTATFKLIREKELPFPTTVITNL